MFEDILKEDPETLANLGVEASISQKSIIDLGLMIVLVALIIIAATKISNSI